MSIFGGVDQVEFDKFKSQVSQKIATLESEIRQKATDSEETAKSAAINAAAHEAEAKKYVTDVRTIVKELEEIRNEYASDFELIRQKSAAIEQGLERLDSDLISTHKLYDVFVQNKTHLDEQISAISEKAQAANVLYEKTKELPVALSQANDSIQEVHTLIERIRTIQSQAISRASEIEGLHKKVFGEDVEDEGKNLHINGLLDELERTYVDLSKRAEAITDNIDHTLREIEIKYDQVIDAKRLEFKEILETASLRYDAIDEQLKGLLPGAMAAGLSAAYEEKKREELESMLKFERAFKHAILALVAISLIPIAVDICQLVFQGKELAQVIKDTPNLVVAILPIYFPVLWLAYSTNKKLNLSKRLIEEYTHKAVLGKTFSGLSNQIETLPHQGAVKEELRTRLLFNVLQVSAENPGKLITNYNKSDHPLMEAVENSAKLSDALDALSKIPGFSSIAKKIAEKTEEFLKAQSEKVETGLSTNEVLEVNTDASNTNK